MPDVGCVSLVPAGVFPCRVVHGMAPSGAPRPPSGDARSCGCTVLWLLQVERDAGICPLLSEARFMVVVACCLESSGDVALLADARSSSERARVAGRVPAWCCEDVFDAKCSLPLHLVAAGGGPLPCHCVPGSVALPATPRPPSGDAWRFGCAVVWVLKVGHGVWCFTLVSASVVVAVEACRACRRVCPAGVALSGATRPPSGDALGSGCAVLRLLPMGRDVRCCPMMSELGVVSVVVCCPCRPRDVAWSAAARSSSERAHVVGCACAWCCEGVLDVRSSLSLHAVAAGESPLDCHGL